MIDKDPIFIHAWWRSGSTYIWSKLRDNEAYVCYYEPLHERIDHLSAEMIEASPETARSITLRHPIQTKNYFAEYAALLSSKNHGFSPELSYDHYLLMPEQRNENLCAYIQGLIRGASDQGRTAVLCFCRSQMRSAWMKKTFGGTHIAQIRNPVDQWASFNVEPYFANKMLSIALKLRTQHPLAFVHIEAFERFAVHIAKRPLLPVEELYGFFLTQKDVCAVFLVIWIASALQSVSYCDFILDIDLLSTNLQYRARTTAWFGTVGCQIDFSDCAIPSSDKILEPKEPFDPLMREALKAIRSNASSLVLVSPNEIKKRLASLSDASGEVLLSAVDVK